MAEPARVVQTDRELLRHLERCRSCYTTLPLPPAPRVCAKCGQVKVTPHHSTWPHALKVFLILRYATRHLFYDWRPMQDSWELLLIGNYEGTQSNGRITRQGVAADEVYARAVKDAEEWKTAGSKTDFL